ncbi:hypothetical protein Rhopal_004467-T1 [Rhodotorula paludigena]|uniref:SAP domain-containing protein n=1 Tax=Rhodotorula paludigena TaxID=86838 RepID=A0AAV5GQB2_9BASI|nr:hypothetical protein Rhopal_004467-T1 [Rhodotorula paludigena]
MAFSEADLKALTVVKLKELLAERSLPVTGKKDDLISRLLSSPDAAPTADTTGATASTDEPDGAGLSGTAEATAAAASTDAGAAQAQDEGLKSGAADADAAQPATGGAEGAQQAQEDAARQLEQAREAARVEEDKRRQRAARFGVQVDDAATGVKVDESDELKRKRAEKFGIQVAEDKGADVKMNKSLAGLDSALGSNKRQRVPKGTSKTDPAGEKGVVGAAAASAKGVKAQDAAAEPAAAVAADPELKKRLEEEEEKKRKRAARFNQPEQPQEKKVKVDA